MIKEIKQTELKLYNKMFGSIKRLASHAGSWYPSDKKKLDAMLNQYLERARKDLAERDQR